MKAIANTFTVVLLLLLLAASGPVPAAGNGLVVSAGMEYSTGRYGAAQATDIWYFPVGVRYESGDWMLKLTLPYVRMTGPGNVVGSNGNAVPLDQAGTEGRRSASGQGDVVAAASRNVYRDAGSGLLLDLTGKIKFATADAGQGLGTGENDFSLQADLVKHGVAGMLFASLGRRRMGDPAGSDFRNPWFASLGAAYSASRATQLGAVYETRQRVVDGGAHLSELMAFATYALTPVHSLQGYVVKGFAAGSPDWGGGVVVNSRF